MAYITAFCCCCCLSTPLAVTNSPLGFSLAFSHFGLFEY